MKETVRNWTLDRFVLGYYLYFLNITGVFYLSIVLVVNLNFFVGAHIGAVFPFIYIP